MRHAVTITLNSNDPARPAPVIPIHIAAQERTIVTYMISAAIGMYSRQYGVDAVDVGWSQRWHNKEEA
jgi:hypothetical protein